MMFLLATLVLGAPQTLREAAASSHKMLIGTAADPRFFAEPEYSAILGSEFSVIEPENAMKFEPIHPRPDTDSNPYDFSGADAIVDFAKQHKMRVRGHTLVWYQQVARWVPQANFTPEKLGETLHNHIKTVLGHYKGKVFAWDVVNEAFLDNGSMRPGLWYDKPGIGFAGQGSKYIEQAFRWAHEVDPKTKLFYNDYSCETINAKSDAIYAMVKDFKERKVPITGVGFQMHIDPSFNPGAVESLRKNFERFAKLGLEIHVTEMDVRLKGNDEASLKAEAKIYHDIAQVCAQQKAVKLLQIWGFTDKHSWIPQFNRGSGWALPWDDQYRKKPAYQGLFDGLTGK